MLGIIILIVFFLAILMLGAVIIWNIVKRQYDASIAFVFGMFLLLLLVGFGTAIVSTPVIKTMGGLQENYSEGLREGYVTKLSNTGIIWKTNEGQLQIGTGQMAALQEPWHFSCPDKDVWDRLNKLLGKKVRIRYRQWLLQPYSEGDSGYEVVSVMPLDEVETTQ
jgi:energy-coupling factor transporter transmembrane protein EcfT